MKVLFAAMFIFVGFTFGSSAPALPLLPIIPMLEFAKGGISTLVTISKLFPKPDKTSGDEGGGGLSTLLALSKLIPKPNDSGDQGGGGLAGLLGLSKPDAKSSDDSAPSEDGGGIISLLGGLSKSPLMNIFKPQPSSSSKED